MCSANFIVLSYSAWNPTILFVLTVQHGCYCPGWQCVCPWLIWTCNLILQISQHWLRHDTTLKTLAHSLADSGWIDSDWLKLFSSNSRDSKKAVSWLRQRFRQWPRISPALVALWFSPELYGHQRGICVGGGGGRWRCTPLPELLAYPTTLYKITCLPTTLYKITCLHIIAGIPSLFFKT